VPAPRSCSTTAWRPARRDLERICCWVHQRVVSNDNVVQWDGCRFHLPPQPRRFSFAGARVQIYQTLDGRIVLYCRDTRLPHATPSGGWHFHVATTPTARAPVGLRSG